jgi:hypothetical protein
LVRVEESITLEGPQAQSLQNRPFPALIRRAWDEQSRFPIKVVNVLSQQFARQGLHFFKVNKSVTHVAVARPRYLDMEATPVSDSVQKIVQFIETHPKTTRRKLIQEFVPNAPTTAATTPAAPAPAPAVSPEGAPAPAEGVAPATAEAAGDAQTPAAAPSAQTVAPSPELEALVRDLHWLVHQGHVIEFANGQLETAKKPAPRPEKKKKETPAVAADGTTASAEGSVSTETPEAAPVESSASATSEVPGESHAEPPPEVPAAETSTHPPGGETDTTVAEAPESTEVQKPAETPVA